VGAEGFVARTGGLTGCSFGALEAGRNGAAAGSAGGGGADKGFSCGETLEDESAVGGMVTGSGGAMATDVS
jgi:hypothetical protein